MQRKNNIILVLNLLWLITSLRVSAQIKDDSVNSVSAIIQMDSIVVSASRMGFDVADFIDYVIRDTSFYRAFQNLRFMNYEFENDIKTTFFQSRNLQTYHSTCRQFYQDGCRYMICPSESFSEDYYKKSKPRYFTSELLEKLFFTQDTICGQKRRSAKFSSKETKSWLKDPITQIKLILFQPGTRSTLPVVGKKMDIFDEKMTSFYDYHLSSDSTLGLPTYKFEIIAKSDFAPRKTVVKYLTTHFSKADFQILYRSYHLAYWGGIIKFDIHMKVELGKSQNHLYPERIDFKGFWDVPTKKKEQSKFTIKILPF